MTQTTVTLFAALIGVSGALAGLVVERFHRSFRRLWCVPSGWKLKFMTPQNAYGETTEVNPKEAEAASADYSVSLDLFNGKEIPVGLRDVSVVFTHDDGELVNKPLDARSARFSHGQQTTYTPLAVVNLSPRQWVRLELLGTLSDVEAMKGWRKADFVGRRQRRGLVEGKTYRKTIATRLASGNFR